MKGWKMILQVNGIQRKKLLQPYLYLTKQISKQKQVTGDKDGHFKMKKRTIYQEDITVINIYALNVGVPKYIKPLLKDLKGVIDSNTIIVGYFNTQQSPMDC